MHSFSVLIIRIWAATWDIQQCGMCDLQSLRSACAYAQSDQSLCSSLEYSMTAKLLTKHQSEFLCLTGGYTGLSESTLVKMLHCWKSHVAAHINLTLSMLGIVSWSSANFDENYFFQKFLHEQTVWRRALIRVLIGWGLIWVKSVCKGYQQKIL